MGTHFQTFEKRRATCRLYFRNAPGIFSL